jgi:hypothetical protein
MDSDTDQYNKLNSAAIMRKFLAVLGILFTMAFGSSASGATLSESQAYDRLFNTVERDALYASWTKMACLIFVTETTSKRYFDFAIREKHDGNCPGDPAVSPIVDRYRVYRSVNKILWLQPIDGKFEKYDQVKVFRHK